jgi:hypothetical protein
MTSGGTPMKSKLAFLVLVMVCAGVLAFSAGLAKADTITTGDLSFLCRGGCGPGATAPTSSSFTYDHGLLSLDIVWDNVQWSWDFGSFSKDFYRSLTGKSDYKAVWVAYCLVGSGDLPGQCGDNGIDFYLFLVNGCLDAVCTTFAPDATIRDQIDFTSATAFADMLPDGASGTVTANGVKSHAAINSADVVSTPEPPVLTLLLSGLALLKRKKK